MSFRSTIILFVVALIGAWAAWRTAQNDAGATTVESTRRMLLSEEQLPEAAIDRIELRRAGEAALVYTRDTRGWRQVEPFDHPVDQYSIHQLIAQARRLEVSERIEPGAQELTDLAFDPPKATVIYSWADDSLTIEFGRLGLAGQAFLRIADEENDAPVYVVGQALHERAIQWDPKEWRERRLFEHAGVESDSIVRTAQGWPTMTLARDRRTWRMTEPVATRLDDAARDQLMQAIGNAVSAGFIADQPDDLAQFGLSEPQATLTVTSTRTEMVDGRAQPSEIVQRLLIGIRIGATNDRFGMIDGRPTIVRIPEAALARLLPPPELMAARTASGVNPADIRRIVIRTDADEIALERDLERWRAPDFDNAEVPMGAVNELIGQVTALQATEIAFGVFPAESQVATVTLYGFDLRPVDTVRIAREPNQDDGTPGRWILEPGDGVLRFHPASFQPLIAPGDFGLTR